MKARLWRGDLHYAGVTLHTAASGAINALDTLWLTLDDDGAQGVGEVRLNIQYLHGYSETQVLNNVQQYLARRNGTQEIAAQLAAVHAPDSGLLTPSRMLLEMALLDLQARQHNQPLSRWLGGGASPLPVATNQTLFWGSDAQLIDQAETYLERGFTQLKLRAGVTDFATDLRRLRLLRARFGDAVSLAIDVNGQWSVSQAQAYLPQLTALSLSYVEQPLAVADDAALADLTACGIPLMLDESLNSEAAIARLAEAGGALWGHLKLVKLGGILPTLAAAQRLKAASVPFMIGQMNEGHAATAAAIQLCQRIQPDFAELYGADGLTDDAVSGPFYHQGCVSVPDLPGLGVHFDAARATFLQEFF
ncbi:mandelate racemase/muconate lactonizing enzyme family protein [Erwinia sp. 9145]|uniref:mandelate racemase/muconate lactonizing enzyme family protein n=1 Tax=Erwinia sp. 9145 TaxID=1500895 RepID=UPI000555F2D4|nr:mandelate racemase/muconate lactonizing enzyme family protein [Erwinia sp. 9145]